MRDQTIAEEGVDAVASTIEELIGDDEIERLVLFLERSDGRNGNDAVNPQLLKAVDISAEVQLTRQKAVTASVTR